MNPTVTFTNKSSRSTPPSLESCLAKYRKGNGINDEELAILIAHYEELYNMLQNCKEPSYKLVLDDVWSNLHVLKRFKYHRENH